MPEESKGCAGCLDGLITLGGLFIALGWPFLLMFLNSCNP